MEETRSRFIRRIVSMAVVLALVLVSFNGVTTEATEAENRGQSPDPGNVERQSEASSPTTSSSGFQETFEVADGTPSELDPYPREGILEPGQIKSTWSSQDAITSSVFDEQSIYPMFHDGADRYTYTTQFGRYEFEKQRPHILQLFDMYGEELIEWSTFVVEFIEPLGIGYSSVLHADRFGMTSEYKFEVPGGGKGALQIQTSFFQARHPKITASVDCEDCPTNALSVVWVIHPSGKYFSGPGVVKQDISEFTGNQVTISSNAVINVTKGDTQGVPRSHLMIDWTDSRDGILNVGPLGISGFPEEPGFSIRFPSGKLVIDPFPVANSDRNAPTECSTQRKIFYHNDLYWAFFAMRDDIMYTTSREGEHWTEPVAIGATATYYGFDVQQQGSTVTVTWFDPDATTGGWDDDLHFMKGMIKSNWISWETPADVVDDAGEIIAPPTSTISSDGYFWIAYIHRLGGNINRIEVYRSLNPGETEFELNINYDYIATNYGPAILLVSLPNGFVLQMNARFQSPGLFWRIWSNSGWTNEYFGNIHLPQGVLKYNLLSAVATADGKTHIVYRYETGSLGYAVIDLSQPTSIWFENAISPAVVIEPVVSADLAGNLYAFWWDATAGAISNSTRWVTDEMGLHWTMISQPFGMVSATGLSLSLSASRKIGLVWSDFNQVFFGSIPQPINTVVAPGRPWARHGFTPFGTYFSQLNEHVSPGNGLLTIHQTDLSIPGRGIDLTIPRVFLTPTVLQQGEPVFEEPFPWAPLGKGWSLDFPWIGRHHAHLSGGQRYLLQWDGDIFENREGTHFVLFRNLDSYRLVTSSGIAYEFYEDGRPQYVYDTVTTNKMTFEYTLTAPYKLEKITDTIGRSADLIYTSGKVTSIEFPEGPSPSRIVEYTYNGDHLEAVKLVTDGSEGLITTYYYNDPASDYLISKVEYPSGGKTQYDYSEYSVGTEAQVSMVTERKVLDELSSVLRETSIDYWVKDGIVKHTLSTDSDGTQVRGSTLFNFGPYGENSMIVTHTDENGVRMRKDVSWFGANGRIVRSDSYLGDSEDISYSNEFYYDDWGNLVYSKDAIGHERFQSFANTNTQNAYYTPGSTEVTEDRLIFYDPFYDFDINDWTVEVQNGLVKLDDLDVFEIDPPSLLVETQTAVGFARAIHEFDEQNSVFVLEVSVFADLLSGNRELDLKTISGSNRLSFSLMADGTMCYFDGSIWVPLSTFEVKKWYHLGFRVDPTANQFEFFVDGEFVGLGILIGSGGIAKISLEAIYSTSTTTFWIDRVLIYSVHGTPPVSMEVTGVDSGKIVELLDMKNEIMERKRVGATGTVEFSWNPTSFEGGYVRIWSVDSLLPEYVTPFVLRWALTLDYNPPSLETRLIRTQSGFINGYDSPKDMYVDDSLPCTGCEEEMEDGWVWVDEPLAVSETLSHLSERNIQDHGHRFLGAGSMNCPDPEKMCLDSDDFHLQYIYLPGEKRPSEIATTFHLGSSWYATACWGPDTGIMIDCQGGNLKYGGEVPTYGDRWILLIVKGADIHTDQVFGVDGVWYRLYGGESCWDATAIGDRESGLVVVEGIPEGFKVELLLEPQGDIVPIVYDTRDPGETNVELDLYDSELTSFPIAGTFNVFDDTNELVYISPIYYNISGGDEFEYLSDLNSPGFYSQDFSGEMHDRLIGRKEWQTGRDAPTPVPMETYNKYNLEGRLTDSKTSHEGAWISTSITFDSWGNVDWITEPEGRETDYEYSAVFDYAYVTKITGDPNGLAAEVEYDYYGDTGEVKTVEDENDHITEYSYDMIGRITEVELPPTLQGQGIISYVYLDDQNTLEVYGEDRQPIGSNYPSEKRIYDALGRLVETQRIYNTGGQAGQVYSNERWSYDYNDLVKTYTTPMNDVYTSSYDYLGRVVRLDNPDSTYRSIVYHDVENTQTIFDENGHMKDYAYDWMGRLTSVTEYFYDPPNLIPYTTQYEYDQVGNLLKVIDAKSPSETTKHEYDDLNQRVHSYYAYPGGWEESWQYYDSGLLHIWTDGNGDQTTYYYDKLDRLSYTEDPGGLRDQFTYDLKGNMLSMENRDSTVSYTYDERDRMTLETFDIDGAPELFQVDYIYDSEGNLFWIDCPEHNAQYYYDDFRRPGGVWVDNIFPRPSTFDVTEVTYRKDDSIDSIEYFSGSETQIDYDNRARIERMTTTRSGQTLLDIPYGYDGVGNVEEMEDKTFQYDSLDRLTDVIGFDEASMRFEYDEVGNRLDKWEEPLTETYILHPNQDYATEWAPSSPSADNYEMVYEEVPDWDATYVYVDESSKNDIYHVTEIPDSLEGYSVDWVEVFTWAKVTATQMEGNAQIALSVNGHTAGWHILNQVNQYMAFLDKWYDNPDTGNPWTLGDIDNLRAGIRSGYLDQGEIRVTQVWAKVHVTSPHEPTHIEYDYGQDNRLLSYDIDGSPAESFAYYDDGSVRSRSVGSLTFHYNSDHMVDKIEQGTTTIAEYFYDVAGRRVKKDENGVVTFYAYIGNRVVYERVGGELSGTSYFYVNGIMVLKITPWPDKEKHYYHLDATGNVRLVTDKYGWEIFSTTYDPFGVQYETNGDEKYKFLAREFDEESNLYYLMARYYDPTLGRFFSLDPVPGLIQYPQTLNRYVYGGNNPFVNPDPDGEFAFIAILIILAVSAAVGAAVNTAVYLATTPSSEWTLGGALKAAGEGALCGAVFAGVAIATGGIGTAGIAGGLAGAASFTVAGAAAGAASYAYGAGVHYAETGEFKWDWAEFGMSVGIGAAMGLASWGIAKGGQAVAGKIKSWWGGRSAQNPGQNARMFRQDLFKNTKPAGHFDDGKPYWILRGKDNVRYKVWHDPFGHKRIPYPHYHIKKLPGGQWVYNPADPFKRSSVGGGIHWFYETKLLDWWPDVW